MFPQKFGTVGLPDLAPAVVVHSLADATTALAPGCAVILLSAAGAGVFAGAGWWRALVRQARAAYPATPCDDVLDCADAPGAAMAAIRVGQRSLVLDPACPAFGRVATLARVLPARPPSLDLGQSGARRDLCRWLARRQEDDSTAALR